MNTIYDDIIKKYNIILDDIISIHSFFNSWKSNDLGLIKDNYAQKEDKNAIKALTRVIIVKSNNTSYAYVFFGNFFAYKVKADDMFMFDLECELLKSVDESITEYNY